MAICAKVPPILGALFFRTLGHRWDDGRHVGPGRFDGAEQQCKRCGAWQHYTKVNPDGISVEWKPGRHPRS